MAPAGLEARRYRQESPLVAPSAELAAFAAESFPSGRPLLCGVEHLMQRVYAEFAFDPHFTEIATPLAEVLQARRGVCQDFAHLVVGGLRSLGLAARYVSGYLETEPPPGQPRLQGADASHAWASVFVPNHGWVDFDPTNGVWPGTRHVVVAWGRDYSDVAPIKGVVLGAGQHELQVAVDVERIGTSC